MKMKSGMMMSHSEKPPHAWSNCAKTPFGNPNDLSSAQTNGPTTVSRNISAPLSMSSERSLFFAVAVLSFMPSAFHMGIIPFYWFSRIRQSFHICLKIYYNI